MNKYEIIKDIGVGTFGTVYEAINKITNEKVAIKKLKQKIDSWEKCLNQNEVYFLRKLNHPNIVKLLEVIREKNDDISLVFEYCDYNLYELIKTYKRKQMSISESKIKNIIYSLTLGLSHIHNNGIMHRDLKPENILIRNKEIKIADFGTAKEIPKLNPYNELNSMTDYICTRWYRAPECVLKSKNYNEKVDIWALGCIMAELYNLKPIFPGQSEFDQIDKIFKVLGTPKNGDWDEGFFLMDKLGMSLPQYNGIGLRNLFYDISNDALNFLENIFQYDEKKRPSAEELLKHPYLSNYENKEINRNYENNFNNANVYRKINRDFSKDFIFGKNDFMNYFKYKNNNNNINEIPKTNFLLPKIKSNNLDNYNNSRYNLIFHRNNSFLNENKLFLEKNKNLNLRRNYYSKRYRNKNSEDMNNISNPLIYSNYFKNNFSIIQNDEHTKEQNSNNNTNNNNPFSTLANSVLINNKNYFFDKYENKNKKYIYNNYENFYHNASGLEKLQNKFYLKDKFKNFGYNYFPDGNYRSIFSFK